VSGLVVSPEARHVVADLSHPDHPSVARIMRHAGINRRTAKKVLQELVELGWAHRQRGYWVLMPAGQSAARWYIEQFAQHGPEVA
jgi:DNA-binding IclR family transcriptional regulator